MKLKEIASVHDNMSWADFWIVRRGPDIGKVVDVFNRDHIGIMFTADAVFKKCVMPNKLKLWFKTMYITSGPMCSLLKTEGEKRVVCTSKLRKLKLPAGASLG